MGKHILCRKIVVLLSVGTALLLTGNAAAVTHTWTGAAMSGSMNNAGNWTGGTPVSGNTNLTLIFPSGTFNNLTQDIANPLNVQALQFNSGFVIGGANPLRLTNLGAAPTIDFNGTGMQSVAFTAPVEFAAATNILVTGSSVTSMSFESLSGTDATFDSTGGSHTYSLLGTSANSLTGSYLVKGMSQLRLAKSSNTAAIGGIVTADGSMATVSALSSNQFAAGADVKLINGGQLLTNGTSQSIDELVVESGGMMTFGSNETLTINGTISSSAGLGSVGFGLSGTIDFAGQFKTVNVTSTGAGDMLRLREKIINGRINKTGAGKLEIGSESNSFSGVNVVSAGTLSGNPASIGTVTNNDKVELSGFGILAAGQISGPGQVIISNTNIIYGAAQAYAGGTQLDNGSAAGDASTLLGNFTSTGNSSLQFGQNTNATWGGTLSGTAGLGQSGAGVLSLTGTNNYSGSTFVSTGGGIDVQSDTAIGTGSLNLFGPIRATGSRTLANVLVLGVSTFEGAGSFNFTDTTVKQPSGGTTHNSSGITNIAGKWLNGANTIMVTNGQLAIGDAAVVNGFTSSGPTIVNGGTLTLRSLNFITLPDVTLAGGTLATPNGYAIPLGAVLQGNGAVTGRVASANGSSILANGNLTVGDAAHATGVNLDGELYTNQFAVTLNDSNQAVVGSLTHLGNGTSNGTLNAPNGLVVNFGRNITGRGQINSTNTLAKAVIMNGDVQGDSFANYLEFTGYVKGVGTFNNAAFSGTFAPGLSPAVVTVGNALLGESSVLDMEIGGTQRGAQYDGINIAGTMSLNGELKLSLLEGFTPSIGSEWQLFAGSTVGMFTSYDFPSLAAGLTWDTSELYSQGTLSVVAGLTGDLNGDGTVDPADYVQWRNGLGTTHAPADFRLWQANFGRSAGVIGPLGTAVPEPTMPLLVIGLLIGVNVATRRRLSVVGGSRV